MIRYVPASHQLFSLPVKDNILFGAEPEERSRLTEAAEKAHFDDAIPLGQIATSLSGGQQQRVNIARALIHSTEVLLLDEPTSSLDLHTADQVMRTLLSSDATVLCVTHDPKHLPEFTRVIELRDGRVYRDSGSGEKKELDY